MASAWPEPPSARPAATSAGARDGVEALAFGITETRQVLTEGVGFGRRPFSCYRCLSQPSMGYRAAGQARPSLPVPQQRAGPPPAVGFGQRPFLLPGVAAASLFVVAPQNKKLARDRIASLRHGSAPPAWGYDARVHRVAALTAAKK